jgi:3-hydroxyacyl-CoA dehydrogenase
MEFDKKFEQVTVLGAAGKMGRGILLLTAVEMLNIKLKPENHSKKYQLFAMDVSQEGLKELLEYIRKQVRKTGERKIDKVKELYTRKADLKVDEEVIDRYVADVINLVKPVTDLKSAFQSGLIFEAINENQELKTKILSEINGNNPGKPWFLTNTSSVPIHELDEQAGLGGRIMGFHFYNPPPVQKLVEIIVTDKTIPELAEFSKELAKRLGKVTVSANDVAGFIGNGHFMRETLFGINKIDELTSEMNFTEAVYTINTVSWKFLIRPMGIFQLIDYVGLDVVQLILKVMNPHFPDESLHSPLLDKMNSQGVKGGQNPDGSQRSGFLQYEAGKIVGIYDPDKNDYMPVQDLKTKMDEKLGYLPLGKISWKELVKNPDKEAIIEKIFKKMITMDTFGAKLAIEYGTRSKEIGYQLIDQKVANSERDVNTVLLTGFYHVYGPINDFFNYKKIT